MKRKKSGLQRFVIGLGVCLTLSVAAVGIYIFNVDYSTDSKLEQVIPDVVFNASNQAPQISETISKSAEPGSDQSDEVVDLSQSTSNQSDGMSEPAQSGTGSSGGAVGAEPSLESPYNSNFGMDSTTVNNSVNAQQPLTQQPLAEQVTDGAADEVESAKKTDMPVGNLVISGRVLTRAGVPVSDLELTLTATYLFDRESGKLVLTSGYQRVTSSGFGGFYEFEQLVAGEYQIRAPETERFAEAHMSVRAGVNFADLILLEQRSLRVHGVVSTAFGEPMAGTQIRPTSQMGQAVTTDTDGKYTLALKVPENVQSLSIRSSKDGYREEIVSLETTQLDAGDDVELNIVMQSEAAALGIVSGTVRSATGEPVAGQQIRLSSAKARQGYPATTDTNGEFVIQGLEISDDYALSINAADIYEDHFEKNLQVTSAGLILNIKLKTKDVGTLGGQMVDLYGSPISNFSLVLQTKKTSYYNQRVVGDEVGAFTVERAPAGELQFKTKSNPHHQIEGIQLTASTQGYVSLVLDSGYDEIRGRIVDRQGFAVAVPNISLTWSHEQDGLRSSSRRTTASDEQGDFHFTQLGPGVHTISINAAGFKRVRLNHDVATQGYDVFVQLEQQ